MGTTKLILAPPGAGKTRRLVQDVQNDLAQGARLIIPVTFTGKAAGEITERLGGAVVGRTAHNLGNYVLGIEAKMRGERPPHIIAEEEARSLLRRAIVETGDRAPMQDVQIALKAPKPDRFHPVIVEAVKRYWDILRAENLIDFDGILARARIAIRDPLLLAMFAGASIYLDEFQDTDPEGELPFIMEIASVASSFQLTGDPRQSIFSFRGADWERVRGALPGDTVTEWMTVNHRSTPEIVETGNRLAIGVWEQMVASRASIGSPVRHVDALTSSHEMEYLANQVALWLNAGVPPKDIAILVRLHEQATPIERALRMRGIDVILGGGRTSIFDTPAANAMLGYAEMAIGPSDDEYLERVIDFPPSGFSAPIRTAVRGEMNMTWNLVMCALAEKGLLPEHAYERVRQIILIRNKIRLMQHTRPVPELLMSILRISGVADHLITTDFHAYKAIEGVIRGEPFRAIHDFVEYMRTEIARPRGGAAVTISTIHASKGLEWPCVIMPNMQIGILPYDRGEIAEEGRLAFVGATRAKDHLLFLSHKQMPASPYVRAAQQQEAYP